MTALRFAHLADRLYGQPLMLHPGKLRTVVSVLSSRMGLPSMDGDWPDDEMPDDASVAPSGGDGVAVIPIHGSLVHRASGMDAMSGMRSYGSIHAEFADAMADGNVSGIVLHIDSGGGEVAGAFDLADAIFAARGTKPIIAVASEHAYSAAYLLASAADRAILPRTGGVGSIGVVSVHLDVSGADEKGGVTYTPIFAGAKKVDFWPHASLSDRARAEGQAEVDRLYGLFCETVARNRGLSVSAVRATEAGCLYGADAVTAGLADEVGLFSDAIHTIMPARPAFRGASAASTAMEISKMPPETVEAGASPAESPDVPGKDDGAPDCADVAAPSEPPAAESPAPAASVQPAPVIPVAAVAPDTARAEGHSAAMAYVDDVIELCAIAKAPSLAAGFIQSRASVADVRKALINARADDADSTATASHAPVSGGPKALERLNAEAAALRKGNAKLTEAQAFAEACTRNPALYNAYRAETRNS